MSGNVQDFLKKMLFLALIFSPDVFLGLVFSKISDFCDLWPWTIQGFDTELLVILSGKNLVYLVNLPLVITTSKKNYCLLSKTYCFGTMRNVGTLKGSCNFGTYKYKWCVKCLVVALLVSLHYDYNKSLHTYVSEKKHKILRV